jgi:hypothetical protein
MGRLSCRAEAYPDERARARRPRRVLGGRDGRQACLTRFRPILMTAMAVLRKHPVSTVCGRFRQAAGAYLLRSRRLSSMGSSLWSLMRLMRFSIPKSVKAITPSSPIP